MCGCGKCPAVPIEECKCCCNDAKVLEDCSKDGVQCIIKLAKMAKVWDKVNNCFLSETNLNLNLGIFQDILEIALNCYDETLCLGNSWPPSNK